MVPVAFDLGGASGARQRGHEQPAVDAAIFVAVPTAHVLV
jgi:hypothetical protein